MSHLTLPHQAVSQLSPVLKGARMFKLKFLTMFSLDGQIAVSVEVNHHPLKIYSRVSARTLSLLYRRASEQFSQIFMTLQVKAFSVSLSRLSRHCPIQKKFFKSAPLQRTLLTAFTGSASSAWHGSLWCTRIYKSSP